MQPTWRVTQHELVQNTWTTSIQFPRCTISECHVLGRLLASCCRSCSATAAATRSASSVAATAPRLGRAAQSKVTEEPASGCAPAKMLPSLALGKNEPSGPRGPLSAASMRCGFRRSSRLYLFFTWRRLRVGKSRETMAKSVPQHRRPRKKSSVSSAVHRSAGARFE